MNYKYINDYSNYIIEFIKRLDDKDEVTFILEKIDENKSNENNLFIFLNSLQKYLTKSKEFKLGDYGSWVRYNGLL